MAVVMPVIYKILLFLFALVVAIFYEVTIPLINAVIKLKINILGFFLEPFLQWAFDISLREAQIISAWLYLLAASIILWLLFRKMYAVMFTAFYSVRQFWLNMNKWHKIIFILLIILLITVIGKAVLMVV